MFRSSKLPASWINHNFPLIGRSFEIHWNSMFRRSPHAQFMSIYLHCFTIVYLLCNLSWQSSSHMSTISLCLILVYGFWFFNQRTGVCMRVCRQNAYRDQRVYWSQILPPDTTSCISFRKGALKSWLLLQMRIVMVTLQQTCTPWKINGWNLKITCFKRTSHLVLGSKR